MVVFLAIWLAAGAVAIGAVKDPPDPPSMSDVPLLLLILPCLILTTIGAYVGMLFRRET